MENKVLETITRIADAAGTAIFALVQRILPQASLPQDLISVVGFLTVLTVALLAAGAARRIAWMVVGVGWTLVALRIGLAVMGR